MFTEIAAIFRVRSAAQHTRKALCASHDLDLCVRQRHFTSFYIDTAGDGLFSFSHSPDALPKSEQGRPNELRLP